MFRTLLNMSFLALAFLGYLLGKATDPNTQGCLFVTLLLLYLGAFFLAYTYFMSSKEIARTLKEILEKETNGANPNPKREWR